MTYRIPSLLAAVSLAAFASPAMADEIYIQASAGISGVSHSIERNLGPNPPALPVPDAGSTSTAEDSGSSWQLTAGYQFDIPDSPTFIAVEGFYGIEDADTRNINGVLVTDVDLDARYGARAVFGVDVSDKLALYTHGGLSFVDYDVNNSYTFAPPVTERSDNETAFSYGVGLNYKLNDTISFTTDYTRLTDIDFDGIPEVAGGTGRVNPNRLALDRFSSGIRLSF